MCKDCQQVNIPQVDNTNPPCGQYMNDFCVVITKSHNALGLTDGVSLMEYIDKLESRIQLQSRRLNELENKLKVAMSDAKSALINGSENSDDLITLTNKLNKNITDTEANSQKIEFISKKQDILSKSIVPLRKRI
jgi:hypothetical protein